MVGRLAHALLDTLTPQRCLFCDQPSGSSTPLCRTCEREFVFNRNPCPRCALPDCNNSLCPACLARPPALTSVTAPLVYDPALAYLMHRWKYCKEHRFVSICAYILQKYSLLTADIDVLLCTPLHWRRLLSRGFNQSEDLLRALCRADPRFRRAAPGDLRLQRVRAAPAQAGSTRRARLGNLAGAFRVRGDPRGLSIAIVDDVCTTGATGNAMADALLEAGAREIHLLCVARTPGR